MKKPELRPFPGQEPKRIKSDLTVFDRCNVTRRVKLLDEELLPTIEERPERQPYTLKRRKRLPRPFLSPAGEVVLRLRGGEASRRSMRLGVPLDLPGCVGRDAPWR